MKDQNEYNLDLIELETYYNEIETLFLFKRTLLEKYLDSYDNDGDIGFLNYLLTRKIIEMKK